MGSAWYRNAVNQLEQETELVQETKSLIEFAVRYKNRTFEIQTEHMSDLSMWDRLFQFLGEDRCVAKGVLNLNSKSTYSRK